MGGQAGGARRGVKRRAEEGGWLHMGEEPSLGPSWRCFKRVRGAAAQTEISARSAEVGARSAEIGARSAEVGARSAEIGARSGEIGARSELIYLSPNGFVCGSLADALAQQQLLVDGTAECGLCGSGEVWLGLGLGLGLG